VDALAIRKPITRRSIVQAMHCAGLCGVTFSVVLERKEDLSMTHVSDTGESTEGFAVYRDRVLVKCPHCKGLCKILPQTATVEVIKR
jgi:hypothetical protein